MVKNEKEKKIPTIPSHFYSSGFPKRTYFFLGLTYTVFVPIIGDKHMSPTLKHNIFLYLGLKQRPLEYMYVHQCPVI